MNSTLLGIASIGLLGIACQWFGWWVKLPAILFLLLAGILVGPVLGWLDPDLMFGDLLFPFVSLAVAVILFEGSLTLKLRDIRGLERVVRKMVSVGLLITWIVATLACAFALAACDGRTSGAASCSAGGRVPWAISGVRRMRRWWHPRPSPRRVDVVDGGATWNGARRWYSRG